MKKIFTLFLLLTSLKGFSQQPIFATIAGGDLYSFDITNCTRHFIGSTGQGFGDIAFTPDGRLWGIAGGQLYQIDTATANATLIGTTGLGAVSLVGLNDTTLLGEYGMKLYGITTTTATPYYIDTIGYQAAGDLTWYDDDLYMVTSDGQIIKMTLNSSSTAITSVTPIGSSIPSCEGAVTASFDGNYNSMVGFNGQNLIKICQIDGSYQTLCADLNIGGTPGAASIRLTTQVPQPTVCNVVNSVFENTIAKSQLEIFPNPSVDQITIKTIYNWKFKFVIYNSFGQSVKTGRSETNSTTIDINDLTNGIYSIELSGDNKMERKCFMVKK